MLDFDLAFLYILLLVSFKSIDRHLPAVGQVQQIYHPSKDLHFRERQRSKMVNGHSNYNRTELEVKRRYRIEVL